MKSVNNNILNVDNVNTYISRTKIVKNASFKVAPGEIVGLIGPNGAGKTTIMKTILGLTSFSGKISIVNDPVTENNHQALSEVGALIEHPAVYPFLTGQQNLQLYSHNKEDLENIVSLLQMASFIQSKAKGYSLGMKQKLGIAIALLNKPKLIILDEPMNGLDIESTIRVRKIIKQYADRGTAFLISSHVLSELQKVMTQVILISGGKIIVNKPIEEFNQINHQKYKIIAENNNVALNILQKQGINYIYKDGNITINNEDVFKIQDELFKNKVYLKELVPIEANFEQIVVNILDKQKENNHD